MLFALLLCEYRPLLSKLSSAFSPSLDLLDENVRPFSKAGTYVNDYDVIHFLPFYREALELHVSWATASKKGRPIIVDAGGGTGNISLKILKARPEAIVQLLDINPAMLEYARIKGFPSEHISVSDITEMKGANGERIPSDSVDHVFSHSVLWALKNPEAFFQEAHRVLKENSTLAISTSAHPTPDLMDGFIRYLEQHLKAAEERRLISSSQRANFVDSNRQLMAVLNSPLSRQELIQMGDQNGFDAMDIRDAYVVTTPQGQQPLFTQILFRKRKLKRSTDSKLAEANSRRLKTLGLRLGRADKLDLEELKAFNNRVRLEFHLDPTRHSEATHLDEDLDLFDANYRLPHGNLWILKNQKNQIVGSSAWTTLKSGYGVVRRVYLAPELRGQGIGCIMLSILIEDAKTHGIHHLELESMSSMKDAIKLYKHFGFQQDKDKPARGMVDQFYSLKLYHPQGR